MEILIINNNKFNNKCKNFVTDDKYGCPCWDVEKCGNCPTLRNSDYVAQFDEVIEK